MSALQLDYRDPDCDRFHLHQEYLYITPTTAASATTTRRRLAGSSSSAAADDEEPEGGWIQVAQGKGLSQRYRILTGDTVAVTLATNSTPGSGGLRRRRGRSLQGSDTYRLLGLEKIKESRSKEIYSGTPIPLRSITYIVSMCGWQPAITREVGDARRLCCAPAVVGSACIPTGCALRSLPMRTCHWLG